MKAKDLAQGDKITVLSKEVKVSKVIAVGDYRVVQYSGGGQTIKKANDDVKVKK